MVKYHIPLIIELIIIASLFPRQLRSFKNKIHFDRLGLYKISRQIKCRSKINKKGLTIVGSCSW